MPVRHIRPYQLFMQLDMPVAERTAHVTLPHRRAGGSLTLLETFALVAALRIVDARRVFEFGTFLGSTTLNLALNTPDNASIYTFDLDESSAAGLEQHPEDKLLTTRHLASLSALDFTGTPVEHKIHRVFGNSLTFDSAPWSKSLDFVFIDGGHDRATVEADTRNALRMIRADGPACIAWHDYANRDYPELSEYLEDLSSEHEVIHIEDTMLCVAFSPTLPIN